MASTLSAIADTILIATALNVGAIGITDGRVDPVGSLTKNNHTLRNILYITSGVAGVYAIADRLTHSFGTDVDNRSATRSLPRPYRS